MRWIVRSNNCISYGIGNNRSDNSTICVIKQKCRTTEKNKMKNGNKKMKKKKKKKQKKKKKKNNNNNSNNTISNK